MAILEKHGRVTHATGQSRGGCNYIPLHQFFGSQKHTKTVSAVQKTDFTTKTRKTVRFSSRIFFSYRPEKQEKEDQRLEELELFKD